MKSFLIFSFFLFSIESFAAAGPECESMTMDMQDFIKTGGNTQLTIPLFDVVCFLEDTNYVKKSLET
jgi:hypothetical protein